jgi:hypothetical protein
MGRTLRKCQSAACICISSGVHPKLPAELQDANGEVINVAPNDGHADSCSPLGFPLRGQRQDGRVGYAFWRKVDPAVIESFESTWRDQAQTQFRFESIEANGSKAILLPTQLAVTRTGSSRPGAKSEPRHSVAMSDVRTGESSRSEHFELT